jgi:hypothetical protein
MDLINEAVIQQACMRKYVFSGFWGDNWATANLPIRIFLYSCVMKYYLKER